MNSKLNALYTIALRLDAHEAKRLRGDYPETFTDPDDEVMFEHDLITEIDCHEHAPHYFGPNMDTDKLGKWLTPDREALKNEDSASTTIAPAK